MSEKYMELTFSKEKVAKKLKSCSHILHKVHGFRLTFFSSRRHKSPRLLPSISAHLKTVTTSMFPLNL